MILRSKRWKAIKRKRCEDEGRGQKRGRKGKGEIKENERRRSEN